MYQSINSHDFIRAFDERGRGEQFSREALGLLFDYFEQLEDDTGNPIELDVIAICCEFAESTTDEIIDDYDLEIDHDEDEDEKRDQIRRDFENRTSVVGETEKGIVYMQF